MDISHIVSQDTGPAYKEEETVIQLSLIHIIFLRLDAFPSLLWAHLWCPKHKQGGCWPAPTQLLEVDEPEQVKQCWHFLNFTHL